MLSIETNQALFSNKPVHALDYLAACRAAIMSMLPNVIQVQVRISKDTACVDLSNPKYPVVMIPVPAGNALMTRHQADTFTGYWLHELLHILYTDANAFSRAGAAGYKEMTNSIEDCRIEVQGMRDNVARNLFDCLSRLRQHSASKLSRADILDCQTNIKALSYVIKLALNRHMGINNPYADIIIDGCHFQAQIEHALNRYLDLDVMADTMGAFKLAQEIQSMPDAPEQPEQGESEEGESEDGESGESEDGESEDGESEDGESEDGESGDSSEPDSRETDSNSKAKGSGGMSSQDNVDGLWDNNQTKVKSHYSDGTDIEEFLDDPDHDDSKLARGARVEINDRQNSVIDGLTKGCQKLENNLRKLLASPASEKHLRYQETGRLDSRSFSRVMAGDTRAFKRTQYTDAENTAVAILTDVSGSMSGSAIYLAAAFERIAVRAMQKASVPYMLMAFDDHKKMRKGFNETLNAKQADIRAVASVNMISGSTGLTPAILSTARQLVAAKFNKPVTSRKLIIITDGGCDYGIDNVEMAINYARLHGVDEIITIMIGYDLGLGEFSDKHAVIDHYDNENESLAQCGLELMLK